MELKNYVLFKVDHDSWCYINLIRELSTVKLEYSTKLALKSKLDGTCFNDDLACVTNNPASIAVQSNEPITEQTHPELFI